MKNYSMKKIIKLLTKIKFLVRKDVQVALSANVFKDTILEGGNKIYKKADIEDSKIGFGTYIGINTSLPKTEIGRFCTIGSNVKLIRGNHPAHEFVSIHPAFYSTRKQAGFTFVEQNKFEELSQEQYVLNIGNDVWIGANVLIIEGVKIGDGAIIGSGAVVSKDIEPYSINVGNPIKKIGQRFDDLEIKKLLKIKWWDKDITWIKKNAQNFDHIKVFLKNL